MKKIVVAICAVTLLAAGCGKKTDTNTNQTNANTSTETPREGFSSTEKNSLIISAQTTSGEVLVDQAYLEKPGFVVVHKIEKDLPGSVMAASGWLDTGLSRDFIFKAPLAMDTIYFALLYEDDGDKKFDIQKDKILPLYSGAPANYYNDKFVVQFKSR